MAKKPGKYDAVIGDLKFSYGADPDRQEALNGVKKAIVEFVPDPAKPEPTMDVLEDFLLEGVANVDVVCRSLRNAMQGDISALKFAEIYAFIRKVDDELTLRVKLNALLMEAYEQLMHAQYEAEGVTMRYLPDGSSIRCGKEPHAVVVDRDANRKWAIENGLESSLALPWQTVNAMAKKALLEGEPEIPGVELESWPTITYTEKK